MSRGRSSFSQALAAFDDAAILASLSDDVTIHFAVSDEPLRGREAAGFLFEVLTKELSRFELVQEIVEADHSVVVFESWLGEVRAHGLNVVECQADGLVGQLTVFFRPLVALGLIGDAINRHMEQRFRPPRGRRHGGRS